MLHPFLRTLSAFGHKVQRAKGVKSLGTQAVARAALVSALDQQIGLDLASDEVSKVSESVVHEMSITRLRSFL